MHSKVLIWIFVGLLLCHALPVQAQKSKAQCIKEKQVAMQRIKAIQKILSSTLNQKEVSIGQLTAINRQIESSVVLMKAIVQEIALLEQEIKQTQQGLTALENDLAQLKKEYAAMVYTGVKTMKNVNKLVFIFSSSSFHQLIRRLKYIKQYTQARKQQFKEVKKVTALLKTQQCTAEEKKGNKKTLLQAQDQAHDKLLALKQKQVQMVAALSKQHEALQKELAQRNAAVKNLDKLISDIIQKELAAAHSKKSLKPSSQPITPKIMLTPAAKRLSAVFSKNQGKLPWPVKSGFVSGKFGTHAHPVFKEVAVENLGIDIQSHKGETVYAIFSGIVKTIAFVPGMNKVVIIQHGKYHTVYAKLENTTVKVGQHVQAQAPIGVIYTDRAGTTELQFQIWKNTQKLNPALWLMQK